MLQNAARTGLARLGRVIATLAALLATPAMAGDRAIADFIGFSEDGRYFAFEEFGVQDGSGFAYANVYMLDIEADQWVKGTPVRVRLDDESSTVAAARAEAMTQARPQLQALKIDQPADIIALNADGAVDGDPQSLRFGKPGYGMSEPQQSHELALTNVEAKLGKAECAEWSESDVTGFALSLTRDGKTREVYRDTKVPQSRGCPQGYRLYGVVTPFNAFAPFSPDSVAGMVAIVSVYSLGFEGPDRRFLAVPLHD